MSGPLFIAAALVLAALVLLGARVLALVRARRPGPLPGASSLRWLLLGLGCAGLLWVVSAPLHGSVLAAPPVAAAAVLVGLARCRGGAAAPEPPQRRASLVPRTARSLLGRCTPTALRLAVFAAAAGLVGCGLAGDPGGRSFTTASGGPGGLGMTVTTGPWPGWFYGLPGLAGLALCWLAFEVALARIVRRPARPDGIARRDRARLAATALVLGVVPVVGALMVAVGSALGARGAASHTAGLLLVLGGLAVLVGSAAGWLVTVASAVRAAGWRPGTSGSRRAVRP